MQQHSGQHLLSAILEKQYSTMTLSWWMAENGEGKTGVSYIEVDKPVSDKDLVEVQEKCNEVIREALTVTVTTYNVGDPELEEAHTRGLPSDHSGPVRVVTIPGVDTNLCCGTHVSNTSQLQMVHLMGIESKKNKHYLYFLVGGRVSAYLQSCVSKERALTKLLNNAPEEHLQLVDKMQKSLKITQKSNSNMLKEIARSEAMIIKNTAPLPPFCFVHRKDGDVDFVNTFLKEMSDSKMLIVVITGDSSGQLVVTGDAEKVQIIGKKLCELLDGKGGGKGERFNAKLNSLKQVSQAELFVKSNFTP